LIELIVYIAFPVASRRYSDSLSNAAFTLIGFDDQERNLTFVKTAFQVLKQAFYILNLTTRKYIFTSFPFGTWLSNLHM